MSASVLSLSERAFIEKAQRDAAYKKTVGNLEVFISPQLQGYQQLFVSLLFSPSEIEIILPRITSPYQWEIVSQSTGTLLFQVASFSAGNVDEGILLVPFSGNVEDITVEFVSDERDSGVVFALGALDTFAEEAPL
jgi:hypothetical protein